MTRIDVFARGLLLAALSLVLAACAGHQTDALVSPRAARIADAAPDGTLAIHTLPVGTGNCQVVQCPSQNKLVVVDCGSRHLGTRGWTADEAGSYIRAMIDGETEVVVAVSHPDPDHYNYLPTVLDDARVVSLYLGGQMSDYDERFRIWVANLQRAHGLSVSSRSGFYASPWPESALGCWRPNPSGGFDMDVAAWILAMNAGTTPNDGSMVISMRYGDFSAMFTGDMTAATERAIHDAGPVAPLGTDVITGAHGGADSDGSNSPGWADATRPELLIFSAGRRYQHPRCASVDSYLPYLQTNSPRHGYACGRDGEYERRVTDDAVAVTEDNGLIEVRGRSDGMFGYEWSISDP